MSIEGQGHFFTIYFPGFVCFVLYWAKISGERLQDHWSSGFLFYRFFSLQVGVGGRNKNKIHSDSFYLIQLENGLNEFYFYFTI